MEEGESTIQGDYGGPRELRRLKEEENQKGHLYQPSQNGVVQNNHHVITLTDSMIRYWDRIWQAWAAWHLGWEDSNDQE